MSLATERKGRKNEEGSTRKTSRARRKESGRGRTESTQPNMRGDKQGSLFSLFLFLTELHKEGERKKEKEE